MKNNVKVLYIVLMICFVVFFNFNTVRSEELGNRTTSEIWKAIQYYLEWKSYWFDSFEGREYCYENLVGKNTQIDFYITTFSGYSKECNGSSKKKILTTVAYAYIHGTSIIFDVVDLNDKPRAVIGISSGKNCVPGDLVKKTLINYGSNTNMVSAHIKWPQAKQLELPTVVANLKNTIVINAIKRSMSNLLVNYESNKERKIFVGRFTENDPFILIYDKEEELLYQLIFPSISILNNTKMCLSEYLIYRLNNPTEKREEDFYNYLRDKIMSNSFEVSLN